jgi:hypothetical protein
VARAEGIELPADIVARTLALHQTFPRSMYASMAHDLANGRPLELDSFRLRRAGRPVVSGRDGFRRVAQFAKVFFRKATAACAALSRARLLPSTVAPTAPQPFSAAANAGPCKRVPVVRSYA